MYILLFLLWIALNGRITVEIAIFGVVISGVIFWLMCKFMEYSPKSDVRFLKNIFRAVFYICALGWEIIKSSLAVIKIVFSPKIEIQPQIVFFKVNLKNEFLRTVLANSITLTPGTITVNVEEDVFCVHALDYTMAQDFKNSVFVRLLTKMEEHI